jgi:flagellar biosynthesis protein FlhF
MKMKQISATTMQEAMELARRQLGEDAVLLETKKISSGGVVVTFAVESLDTPLFDDELSVPADPIIPSIPRAATTEVSHPAIALVREALELHHVPLALSEKILTRLYQIKFAPNSLIETAESALSEALNATLAFKPIATAANVPPQRALMLVGAFGAGKTSTIAKLATELTLHKQRVVILSTDNERLGATDALSSLTQLLQCTLHLAEDRSQLKPFIKQYVGQAWVLIDTAGVNIYEFQQLKALGELATIQGIEPILTCPAGIDPFEAQETASVLGFLNIERMIITRADAARRLSSAFAALTHGGLALANMSSSASPSDAATALSPAALARLMLRDARSKLTH